MNPLKALLLPEYLFNPRQILLRLRRRISPSHGEIRTVRLPWAAEISVRPHEVIGARLWYYGIFDMEVAELIFRLLDKNETALDIGANIGVMTTLMCAKVGPHGEVAAFEPHPTVFEELRQNVTAYQSDWTCKPALHQIALSDRSGPGIMKVGSEWDDNRGTARIIAASTADGRELPVTLARVDSMFNDTWKCDLCKIDVEGHELAVLTGAHSLLSKRKFRDIIFEDRGRYPTAVQRLLQEYGYCILSVHKRLLGPALVPLTSQPEFKIGYEGENFLATLEPQRAIERCSAKGWKVLSARSTLER
jgi:FkbM family methyltransferase